MVISAASIILAGLVLRLIDRSWVKERRGWQASIVPTGLGLIIVIIMMVFVYKIVWPIPKREYEVKGMVVDKYGQVPVKGARVIVEKFSAKTGNEGRFTIRFRDTQKKEIQLSIEKDNYAPWRGYVPIDEFEKIELDTLLNTE
jgi:hypothetical protein